MNKKIKITNNNDLQERKNKVFARGQGNAYPVYIKEAKNSEVWDVEGNRLIDFGTGIAVCNTGHSHPRIIEAVKAQIENFSHTCFTVTPYEVGVKLAEKLTKVAPGKTEKKAMFATTGAEAVENCIKIARAHTGRRGIIAFNGGFHGRTNMTMALTGKTMPYKKGFGPFPAEIYHLPYPTSFNGTSVKDTLTALKNLFKVDILAEDVAAIIIEPIQGEGGFYQTPVELLQELRRICDENGIVLIIDEIQTGFARTGKMFNIEYAGIEPDLMTMAKGIAGGYPLSGVVGKAEIMDSAIPGGLGGTYGGSPVGCAAGLAVLEIIEEEDLINRANQIGDIFNKRLNELKAQFPDLICDVRNKGAMIALELMKDGDFEKPNAELTKALTAKATEYGLILLSCGFNSNVIRFLPALTISDEVVNEGLDKFTELFTSLS
ncbi:MAG: 4-aminobutyrate--2-oxoglutarate transaminase [Halarcobacter sp.]